VGQVCLNIVLFYLLLFVGFPEMLGGRVKTLHPAVHAGKTIFYSDC